MARSGKAVNRGKETVLEKRIFKASKGSTIRPDAVQRYGEFIWKLREESGNTLHPAAVVEAAKPKSSPIHDFFEWDNTRAGQKYREWQARYLLGRIEVIVTIDGQEDQMRAFHNITVEQNNSGLDRGYVTLKDIEESEEYLETVMENCKRDATALYKRYHQYERLKKFKPLRPLFKAIRQIQV
jgi:hypothetical protein